MWRKILFCLRFLSRNKLWSWFMTHGFLPLSIFVFNCMQFWDYKTSFPRAVLYNNLEIWKKKDFWTPRKAKWEIHRFDSRVGHSIRFSTQNFTLELKSKKLGHIWPLQMTRPWLKWHDPSLYRNFCPWTGSTIRSLLTTFQSFNNFRQFASPTGFGYMFSKRVGVTRRLLWCIFIIFGLGYSLHNISASWKFYKTYPTTIKPAFTEEDKLKFPKS